MEKVEALKIFQAIDFDQETTPIQQRLMRLQQLLYRMEYTDVSDFIKDSDAIEKLLDKKSYIIASNDFDRLMYKVSVSLSEKQ